ncbi:ACP synthase [Haloterrigena sp. SYSU A558-1]|uniref:ACP synthase n=1 Tax=Haloterrigena gelatinilytica TaxID=2741724 RepID=A0A8J8KFD2_9EURY|nr:zinc ribbon domain-containing protein [Haloterrigena gelatinilytica]NUB92218.1 ACP synthase [Haloterrigena gelatinilytica]NUC71952.1 ACP synthase [Haloterrigena gelatinilytica]
MTAITGVGAYAPRFRITAEAFEEAWGQFHAAGITEKAVPAADEDALTMGYEAATRALEAAAVDPSSVDWLAFASSRPPAAEEDLTARLGAMLALDEATTRQLFTGSTRAGTRALWAGMDAIGADATVGLVVAADAPKGDPDDGVDHAAGAGAAAFVLEGGASETHRSSGDGPTEIVDRAEYATPYPGTRFRNTGEDETQGLGVTQYDRSAFTETIGGAVDGLETDPEPDAVAIQAPDGKLPYRAAGAAGVGTDEIQAAATVHELGDLGAASVPVSLATALEDGAESVLAVAHGSGAGADAFVVESSGEVPAETTLEGDDTLSYAEYLRRRGVVTTGPPSGGGAYVSVPSWRRSIPQRYRLEAGRCPDCGALSFPPEGACTDCGSLVEYEPVELPGTGTVEAVTTISQGGAPPEFAEQQARSGDYAAAIVALEDEDGTESVSVSAMATDAAPEAFAVGERIETTIRRIYTQEGVTRYGFKVRPAG